MSCNFSRDVHAWHDGELDEAQCAVVQGHLADCQACRQELRELEGLSRLLGGRARSAMPAEMRQRLHVSIECAGERSILRMAELLTAAAAVLLAIGVGLLVHSRSLPNRPTARLTDIASAEFTMPDEVVSGVASSGDTVELSQWVEPTWRSERQP